MVVEIHYVLGVWRSLDKVISLIFREEEIKDKMVEIPFNLFIDSPILRSNKDILKTIQHLIQEIKRFESVNTQVAVLSGKPIESPRESAISYRQDYQELEFHEQVEDDIQAYLQRTLYKPKFDLAIVSNSRELNLDLSNLLEPYQQQLDIFFQDIPELERQLEKKDKFIDSISNGYFDISPELAEKLSEVEYQHPLFRSCLGVFAYGDRYLNKNAPILEVLQLAKP